MAMARAVRLCPELVIVRPDFSKYRAASTQVFDIFRGVTPLVEGLSLDEAYLDVTENAWHEPLGVNVARRIKELIRERTGLTASAGVAPNKFLAKIASGWKKPDGLTVISPERVESFLQQLPVDALWGVGPVTARKLRARGIEKLIDVRGADPVLLHEAVGSLADWLLELSRGHDDRPVEPNRPAKSCGTENTYARDLTDIAEMREAVGDMAVECVEWLARKSRVCRTVTLKVRYADFRTVTRSRTFPTPTREAILIAGAAADLLDRTDAASTPVRLLGVSVHNLLTDDEAAEGRLPF
jgi:DNA polymerase-4